MRNFGRMELIKTSGDVMQTSKDPSNLDLSSEG